jgi:hypothetical protein
MRVYDLLIEADNPYIREFNTLNAVLETSMSATNAKFNTTIKLDSNTFNGERMYFGHGDSVYYVMWMLTNVNEPLDISSLYSGDDETSKVLRARVNSRPRPPSEEALIIDCLNKEIVPLFEKYGATQYLVSTNDQSPDIEVDGRGNLINLFHSIGLFDAKKIFEKYKEPDGHLFRYLHFGFPRGVAFHHDPVIAKKIEDARVYPKRKRT